MKNFSFVLATLAGLVGFAAAAQPSTPPTFSLSTFQVDFNCTFSNAGAGSQQCSLTEGSQSNVSVTLTASPGSGATDYAGVITTIGRNGEYSFVLITDANQNLQAIMLERDQRSNNGQTINASMQIASTSTLGAFDVDPLTVQAVDSQTIVVAGSALAYGSAASSNIANSKDHSALVSQLIARLQPLVQAKWLKQLSK